ncbi:MAG TPA: DMT family protein [Ignavibacteria bacterium]|nr:DMT family protein [Ignavibacteria bacterium]
MESVAVRTILFLVISNLFMTIAWYGHLKFKQMEGFENLGLFAIILISWGLAFFEYCFMIPANRMGFIDNGGPFNLVQLKVMQEAITLVVFTIFTVIFFKDQKLTSNDFIGFVFLVLAVYFIFKK